MGTGELGRGDLDVEHTPLDHVLLMEGLWFRGSYLRLLVLLSLRLKDLVGPVTRVKKKKKKITFVCACRVFAHRGSGSCPPCLNRDPTPTPGVQGVGCVSLFYVDFDQRW